MLKHCVNASYVEKLLLEASEALDELRSLSSRPAEQVLSSRDLRYALRFSIVMIVEILTDLAEHVLTRCYSSTIESYADAFMKLGNVGILDRDTVSKLVALARLRNLIVHRYWTVDDTKIYRDAKEGGVEAIERALRLLREAIDG